MYDSSIRRNEKIDSKIHFLYTNQSWPAKKSVTEIRAQRFRCLHKNISMNNGSIFACQNTYFMLILIFYAIIEGSKFTPKGQFWFILTSLLILGSQPNFTILSSALWPTLLLLWFQKEFKVERVSRIFPKHRNTLLSTFCKWYFEA